MERSIRGLLNGRARARTAGRITGRSSRLGAATWGTRGLADFSAGATSVAPAWQQLLESSLSAGGCGAVLAGWSPLEAGPWPGTDTGTGTDTDTDTAMLTVGAETSTIPP